MSHAWETNYHAEECVHLRKLDMVQPVTCELGHFKEPCLQQRNCQTADAAQLLKVPRAI